MLNKTIVILGPTCTGKTSVAINLCRRFNGAILSADSRQVVRFMDIGTGKIPAGENDQRLEKRDDRWILGEVDIFGYDLVNPDDYFSAYDFVKYGQEIFSQVSRNGKTVFLVGGTGFYIDAVTGRTPVAEIGPNMELRKSLEKLSTADLAEKLLRLDELAYKTIDTKNPARLIRAIEKATQLVRIPQRFEEWEVKPGSRDENIAGFVTIGLTADRETLYRRADSWVDTVFNEKLFKETRLIQTRFPESHRLKGLIYGSAVAYLAGKTPLDKAQQQAKFAMHAYIRRQQTWFKRSNKIRWFDITQKNFDADITSIVESELHG